VLGAYFGLATFQGVLVILLITRLPSESKNVFLFGFSLFRLTLIGGVLLTTLFFLGLFLISIVNKSWSKEVEQRLELVLLDKNAWGLAVLITTAGLIGNSYFILVGLDISEVFTQAYFVRFQPLALWIAGLSAQTLLALPVFRYGTGLFKQRPQDQIFYFIAIVFSFFLFLWGLIAWTGYGLNKETVGWYRLGAPILETQAIIAWLFGMAFLCLGLLIKNRVFKFTWLKTLRRPALVTDLTLSLLIWLGATLLWSATPLPPSWFASPPQPPNYEYYPNSDASVYDLTAQAALTGERFHSWGLPYAVRPMYALFLVLLHTLRGLGYEPIIFLQVSVLATFPVCFYWLAKTLHNRLSGIIVAAFAIFREANTIVLADVITVSHSKLLMSDMPTALGAMIFTLVIILWLKKVESRLWLPLLAGGVLGMFILIRPEIGVFLPFTVLVAAVVLFSRRVYWLKGVFLLGAGVMLMLAPWLWRNYQLEGKIFLDSPHYRSDLIAQRYSVVPEETEITSQTGETTEDFTERMAGSVSEFVQGHPDNIFHFFLSHYTNSQIQMIQYLPVYFRLIDSSITFLGHRSLPTYIEQCCSAENYVRRLPFWWDWDGQLPFGVIIPLLLNLLLVAIGFSVVWKRHQFTGLAPVVLSIAYLSINALVRNSGGRYILPVDWAGMLYYIIGLAQLSLWVIGYFAPGRFPASILGEASSTVLAPGKPGKIKVDSAVFSLGLAAVIFLIGCLLPLTEKVITPRYTSEKLDARLSAIFRPENDLNAEADLHVLQTFLDRGGLVLQGRALYPRYHEAGKGENGTTWPSFYPRSFPRVSFYLTGPNNLGVVLPVESSPDNFPNAADVLVFGCNREDYFDALAVLIYDPPDRPVPIVLLRSPSPHPACPFDRLE
jgi:hypothetical protein